MNKIRLSPTIDAQDATLESSQDWFFIWENLKIRPKIEVKLANLNAANQLKASKHSRSTPLLNTTSISSSSRSQARFCLWES